MEGRIKAIDMIRGLSIIGMVLCAAYSWDSGLPAFMFHCQEPPPDYEFSPEVRGITWVDLVFPFFLFSMGAAFPVALGKKLQKGVGQGRIVLGLVRRWVTLVIFALVIGNSGRIFSSQAPEIWKGVFVVAGWLALFASLVRSARKWVNPCGYLAVVLLALVEKFIFKVDLSLFTSDIIIMIMAWMALLGGLVWLVSRNSPSLRLLIFALILAVKAANSYTGVFGGVGVPDCLGWLFDWGFCQYLLIVIPATFVGEILMKEGGKDAGAVAVLIPLLAVLTQLWGLYTRNVAVDFCITAALAVAYALVCRKNAGKAGIIALAGFSFLIAGIAFDPLDGGIAKDYCNISYLLCTGGMAGLVTSALLVAGNRGFKGNVLSLCGQNPMIAYTIVSGLISPVLYACGLLGLIDSLATGNMFWGLLRGLIVTGTMCLCTALLTKKKIYWRS